MPQLSDQQLQDSIDRLHEPDLREVLKYLILLNADAVQNAISYVQRATMGADLSRGRTAQPQNSSEDAAMDVNPPPLLARNRSTDSDDTAFSMDGEATGRTDKPGEPRPRQRRIADDLKSPGPSSMSRRKSAPTSTTKSVSSDRSDRSQSKRGSSSSQKAQLLVLCTSKPSSKKQAEDQDKSMLVCKQAGLLPYIILTESKPEEAQELVKLSKLSEYPQFFVRPKEDTEGDTKFLGDFDTIHQLYIQGQFNSSLLKKRVTPTLTKKDDHHQNEAPSKSKTPDSKRLDNFFRQTSEYEESSDDSGTIHSLLNDTATTPSHLQGMHQPSKDAMYEDEKSIDSLGEIFDPPKPTPPEKPLLAAAQKAAADMKKKEDIDRGVPEYLAGLNDPKRPCNDSEDDISLGDDPEHIFDPHEPREEKPLLAAAQKAAAQLEAQRNSPVRSPQTATPTKVPSVEPSSQPTPKNDPTPVNRSAGFSKETISLKSVGKQQKMNTSISVPAGRKGETGSDPADDQPPPSPSASKAKVSLASLSSPNKKPMCGAGSPKLPPAPARAVNAPTQSSPSWMTAYAEQEQAETSNSTSGGPSWTANAASSTSSTALNSSTSSISSTTSSKELERGITRKKSSEYQFPDRACYLVYDAVEGELNIYYSEVPIIGAVGVWTSHDIKAFQEAQGFGKSELIGNCATGVQDRHNYYEGWCQFVKAAQSMDATVSIMEVGVPVDFYLHENGDTRMAKNGEFETDTVDAVACVPRGADFPSGLKGKKWSNVAKKLGAVALFRSIKSKVSSSAVDEEPPSPAMGDSISQLQGAPPTILEDEALIDENATSMPSLPASTQEVQTQSPQVVAASPAPSSIQASTPATAVAPTTPPAPPPPAILSEARNATANGGYASAMEVPNPEGGACFLVYEPDSSGRLVEHYSKAPIIDAIGRWVPAGSKKIAGFKFKQNLGKSILIGNCSAGVQGRKNYSSGWCQFVRSARVMQSDVMLWDPVAKGLMVDVYVYQDDSRPAHQTLKLKPGVNVSIKTILAVACIPKNTPFYEGMSVDILKWLADGSSYGASSRF